LGGSRGREEDGSHPLSNFLLQEREEGKSPIVVARGEGGKEKEGGKLYSLPSLHLRRGGTKKKISFFHLLFPRKERK